MLLPFRSRIRPVLWSSIALLALGSAVFAAQPTVGQDSIDKRLGSLRSLPTPERGKLTHELALEVRKLPASEKKVGLASSLANLATEGDFGQETMQAVADTLAGAVKANPPAVAEDPAFPYTQLAQFSRYEDLKVDVDLPGYKAALDRLVKLESERAKIDFRLRDIHGKFWTLAELKGKVVLLNFWATWCPPCRAEMPDIEMLATKFKDQGLIVLAITDEKLDVVMPFLNEHKYSYNFLLDPDRKINEAFHIDGIPKSFVYDREGKIVAQAIDARSRAQFLRMLGKAGLK